MRRGNHRPIALPRLLAAALALAACLPSSALAQDPVIAAAGDIACAPNNPRFNAGAGTENSCHQQGTASLLDRGGYSAVLPLGDLINGDDDSLAGFQASYEPTWGRYRAISHPAIGNHEYDDRAGATGYWDYWNGVGVTDGPAGVRARGWYAWDLGSWRLIALNSNCDRVGCTAHSKQGRWLRDQLRHNHDRCVLAYMHHPRFSSGLFASPNRTTGLWRALYRGGADVVLNGHDHLYERFAPSRPSGIVDPSRGITQFTVGTGGYFLFPTATPGPPNSEFVYNQGFGVLFMRLLPDSFGWSFVNVDGRVIDRGHRLCSHANPQPRHERHHRHHHGGHKRS
jgi:Calcineurin-like phosphoesterase